MFGDVGARDDFARAAREVFEQRVLLRRQVDAAPGAPDLPRARVHFEVVHFYRVRLKALPAPQQRAYVREQLAEVEGLRQVVVRARVESLDAVVNRVARRHHKDWHGRACGAQFAADLEAVFARKHDVEDYQVVVVDVRLIERALAVLRDINSVGLLAQTLRHHPRRARLVFDQKDTQTLDSLAAVIIARRKIVLNNTSRQMNAQ